MLRLVQAHRAGAGLLRGLSAPVLRLAPMLRPFTWADLAGWTARYSSSAVPLTATEAVDRFRNFGVVAHVDAGKTTTCERMLYYTNATRHLGNVDQGTTVMDYMELEAERGITINAAATSIQWRDHQLSLIDTPGHVDFQVEVDRSMRVLDGAVAVFDAVAGVQAQTETVWRQAERYEVPVVGFVNKMDRDGADFDRAVNSLTERLGVHPLVIQRPVGAGRGFCSVVDLVNLQRLNFDGQEGQEVVALCVRKEPEWMDARARLIEQLAEVDEEIAEALMGEKEYDIESTLLRQAIRRATIQRAAVPICCGAALRNIGVQPVMDMVVDYLPSPRDRRPPMTIPLRFVSEASASSSRRVRKRAATTLEEDPEAESVPVPLDPKAPLCALAFKVVHDPHRDLVVWFRVYSGTLKPGMKVFNTVTAQTEIIGKLFKIDADDLQAVDCLIAGDIGAAIGLSHTSTGDTVLREAVSGVALPKNKKKAKKHDLQPFRLQGIHTPPPVFTRTIEASSKAEETRLDQALRYLELEDPSVHVSVDPLTGSRLIGGMGELHLDVIDHRLKNHYKVDAEMGPVRVTFRSTLSREVQGICEHRFRGSASTQAEVTSVTLQLTPLEEPHLPSICSLADSLRDALSPELAQALRDGAEDAFHGCGSYGLPLDGVHVRIVDASVSSESSASATVLTGINKLLQKEDPLFLEPMMSLEIVIPEQYQNAVVGDLTRRDGHVDDMKHMPNGLDVLLVAQAPLRSMLGYSTQLRSLTQGSASFSMELDQYAEASGSSIQEVVKMIRGF